MSKEQHFQWKIISYTKFTADVQGYHVVVESPLWWIIKDGEIIDSYPYHSPTKCELSTKEQAKKQLYKHLNNIL